MELKGYQREVIKDLDNFIIEVDKTNRLDIAFNNFWESKGLSINSLENDYLRPYDNSVKGIPRVTVKVPTAGGKTFIACNALKTIFDSFPSEKPKVVAWFVPSDTILKQTYQNLNNPNHPYRQKIDAHFGNAVRVVDKESALFGQGISPMEIKEQLTIFVLSVQSFVEASRKNMPRVYRENENLAEYVNLYNSVTKRVDGSDETGLIQVLSFLNPVIIIDESHNFEADLRLDMLNAINPSFIMDLTATPRKKSNIISFVDAIKLKKANMVKLPVVVYNHKTTNDVVMSAYYLQKSLEEKAIMQEVEGGQYIRPIVLFQAQPKIDGDNVTFDKIKQQLIEMGIPEYQIKIKTANKDELKNIDLMSRDCPVRYIITVNALKEGWDCPFAYILASLANKSSKVDVEQILGRILRLPYTTKHKQELLNMSYVFTSSANFRDTLDNIIESLNRAGFSKKNVRISESQQSEIIVQMSDEPMGGLFGGDIETKETLVNTNNDIEIDVEVLKTTINTTNSITQINEIELIAIAVNEGYEAEIKEAEKEDDNIPNDVKSMVKYYTFKDVFKEVAEKITLPTFVKKVNVQSFFTNGDSYVPLTKSMLAEGFDLSRQDHNVNFTRTDAEARLIDLDKDNEYIPVAKNMNLRQLAEIRNHFLSLAPENQREMLAGIIARNIRFDEIAEPQIATYVKYAISNLNSEELSDLMTFEGETAKIVKNKINSLLVTYQERKFGEWLDTGQIKCEASYSFPKRMILKSTSKGLSKGLYTEEGDINDFEYRVINAIANLDNILFWHRNPERGVGFGINGYVSNHYPDFIVQTKSGYTILIETKGDHLDNSDSKMKLALGHTWANKAGENYRYFMVFDKVKMDGALTVNELLERLKNM